MCQREVGPNCTMLMLGWNAAVAGFDSPHAAQEVRGNSFCSPNSSEEIII